MSDRHCCPVEGCTLVVPHHILMCAAHWRAVPARLKPLVYRAWDGYQDGTVEFEDYLKVRQEAIDAVNHALSG